MRSLKQSLRQRQRKCITAILRRIKREHSKTQRTIPLPITIHKVPVRDASKEVIVHLKKQAMLSPEFMELWNKIKQKTAYRVQIDTEKLVEACVKELSNMEPIPKARLVSKTANINIQNPGVTYTEREMRVMDLEDTYSSLPYILGIISEETLIKRATVARIIKESGRGVDFLNNPQAFLERCLEIIKKHRHALAIDGIKYAD